MLVQPLPHDVKKAIDLFRSDLARLWRIGDLAHRCGVPRRTLEKHFQRFVGCAPLEFLRTERLDQARRKLLQAPPGASVMAIAADCGVNHFGRFAVVYRDRYGESPSETLRWRRIPASATSAPYRLPASSERPALALLPFDLAGLLPGGAEDISEAIGAALYRTGWIRIVSAPAGRYHLQGRVRDDGTGTLRIRLMLIDRSISRYVWADCFECVRGDLFGSQEWLSNLVSGVLRSVLCDAEIDRAAGKNKKELTAWELSMRALPMVLAADPAAHATAIELLDRAIESAPRDPVPMSLAAWCHGLRAGHHFTTYPRLERHTALELASRASRLGGGDPLSDAMLSAAYMLAHDLAAAEAHARRALAIDGGSSWDGAGLPGFIAIGAKRPKPWNAAGSRGRSGQPTRSASYGRSVSLLRILRRADITRRFDGIGARSPNSRRLHGSISSWLLHRYSRATGKLGDKACKSSPAASPH